jgi:hypothetical protein
MLPMNPVEPPYVKGPVRSIMPNLGPDSCDDNGIEE